MFGSRVIVMHINKVELANGVEKLGIRDYQLSFDRMHENSYYLNFLTNNVLLLPLHCLLVDVPSLTKYVRSKEP